MPSSARRTRPRAIRPTRWTSRPRRARIPCTAATGRHPAVYLLEIDAIGSSSCVQKMGAMLEWEAALRYEMHKSLPY